MYSKKTKLMPFRNTVKLRKYGFSLKELLAVLAFYFFFSFIYHIVLWYNSGSSANSLTGWMDLKWYWYSSGMQYSMYLIASIILWFLCIFLLRKQRILMQIVAVFIVVPFAVYMIRELRYDIIDSLKMGRLRGSGTVWDLYIPWLFMCIQFGIYFAYRYFKEYQEKLRTENTLRQAALKSEISAIKAQLNPHFLYNVFNTINASLPPENEKTRTMVAQLADLFRYQLKTTKEDFVPLHQEIAFLQKYLDLEKARFEERLTFSLDVDPKITSEKIPPMLLQPIVENCLKHGLSNQIEAGKVSVSAIDSGNQILFKIADTGKGMTSFEDILTKGIGLKNTNFRLKNIYGSELQFEHNQPKGLIVQFWIEKKLLS